MARMKSLSNLTISDLEQLLNRSRSKISKLEKKRAKVSRKLDAIDAQIASLGGSVGAVCRACPERAEPAGSDSSGAPRQRAG